MNSTNSQDIHQIGAVAQIIENTADIGQLVRTQRRQQKLRIDDAAALTHVSVDLFSRLENGKSAVRLDKLLLVLDAMGLCMIVGPKSSPIAQKLLQQKQNIDIAIPPLADKKA
ncbi:MAG: helix-turn-helix domain-containing protein [Pseudomonadota bacterium]